MLRNATRDDLGAIQHLINTNLDKLLPRKDEELLELIDGNTFWIVEDAGKIVGCCCLEVYSAKIAELRSLAVRDNCRGKGYGELLVNAAIDEANRRQIKQVLVVTSTLEFFQRMNFGQVLNEKYALFWNGKTPG